NTLPGVNTQIPSIELAGGQLWVNTNFAATQMRGTMTVSEDSILANANTTADVRLMNGVLNIGAGKTLTVQTNTSFAGANSFNVRMSPTFSGVTNVGTL